MMDTKKEVLEQALRGEGCLGKAADDEPVFVLRAQDLYAPEVVESWANRAGASTCPNEKIARAFSVAGQMRQWPDRKYPD